MRPKYKRVSVPMGTAAESDSYQPCECLKVKGNKERGNTWFWLCLLCVGLPGQSSVSQSLLP